MVAEETIHYPLAQLAAARQILLVSAEGGVMREIRKHRPQRVDYVELNPEITRALAAHGLIESFPELNVIHQDGRTFLQTTPKRYDAIIVNLPEPDTFQINRFYTEYFFKLARSRLTSDGILCFFMKGYSNYLAEPQRQKISSLYNSVAGYFSHVTLLPGHKICFLCRDLPIDTDIPALLSHKGVDSDYIQGFYYGNITAERIASLNALVDPTIPKNRDLSPQLMRIMFDQWFEKFTTSPGWFFAAIAVLGAVYLIRINRTEFVLFSTGCMTMGSEILVIFAFQIYFGYIYFQIGVIVTLFLTGLLPGALWGSRLATDAKRLLALTDGVIIILMGIFLIALQGFGSRLPVAFFLMFGFSISLLCGCQFPIALRYQGDDNPAATRFFSADLIGAAAGTLVTSMVLIPYLGFLKAAGAFILLKSMSLLAIGVVHE
jgi:spermidine synthase